VRICVQLLKRLLRREAGQRPWLGAGIVALVVLLVAYGNARGGEAAQAVSFMRQPEDRFAMLLSLLACVRALHHPAVDHAHGWVHAYCANAGDRRDYVLTLAAAIALPAVAAYVLAMVAYAIVYTVFGGSVDRQFVVGIPVGIVLIGSFTLYGLILGTLFRDFGTSLTAAILGVVLPLIVMAVYALRYDAVLPARVHRAITLHFPPMGMEPLSMLLQNAAYVLVLGVIALRLSVSRVARYE